MNYKLHMIGNAHLDPVWLWQWQEGYAEIKATFRSALDRMNEFPDFIFTCAGAAYYQWVEENAPEMFEEIQQRVSEGRWVIVGGWWIQPDCNLPSGESFARHGLYSQRYFLEKFGVMANVGYNVDSFGHNGMLPQILKKSGMDYYVFMRPQEHEKQLPKNLFWWESPDGSRVLTYRIPISYNSKAIKALDERFGMIEAIAEEQQIPQMYFYGVGNHGGGPTITNIRNIHRVQDERGKEQIIMSSPNQYFAEVGSKLPELPVVKDEDLLMHAIGCYSAHSETKASNRKAEHRLLTAEKFAAVSHIITGLSYPHEKLQHAWQTVLFNQFHDILGGCSIKEAYQDAREAFGEALHVGAVTMNAALQKISWSINTMKEGIRSLDKQMDWQLWEQNDAGVPFVVFNPLSWDVEAPVVVNKNIKTITDEQDKAQNVQTVRASRTNRSDKWDTLFMAKVPAMGYRVYWLYINKEVETTTIPTSLYAGGQIMENDYVRVEFETHTGHIQNIWDKRTEMDVFSSKGAVPVVLDDYESDTWSHGLRAYTKIIGEFTDAEFQLIETGPLRAKMRVTSRYQNSILRQDFILHHDRPDLQVKVQLDWREKHKMLKLSFPVNVINSQATYEIPYGHLIRPVNGEENPGLLWVDLSGTVADDTSVSYGVALLNDSKSSFDVTENELRMTVVRGAIFADHYGERDHLYEFMDQGIQEFEYSLVPHKGAWSEAAIVKKAQELNVPLIPIIETYHEGPLSQTFTGICISSEQIIATVFKSAEDRDGYILRCYETAGRGAETTVSLPLLQREWKVKFGKNEIKTFYIPEVAEDPVTEMNLLELP